MTVGIDIDVKTQKIKDAKREVKELQDSLGKLWNNKNLSLGGTAPIGSKVDSFVVGQLTGDLNRQQSIARAGERIGGLKTAQWRELDNITKRIGKNFDEWRRQIDKVAAGLERLTSERLQLKKLSNADPVKWIAAQDRIKAIDKERAALSKYLDKQESLYAAKQQMAESSGGTIGGFSGMYGVGRMGGRFLGRMARWGTAIGTLGGGLSILSYLKDSAAKEKAFSELEADLAMRGGRGFRSATLGFTPTQNAQVGDVLSSSTGYSGRNLTALSAIAKQFTRGMGVAPEVTTGYMAGMYQATGMKVQEYKELLKALRNTVTGVDARGRTEEFLRINQHLVSTISQSMSGKELSKGQVGSLLALQAGLWMQPGMMGKGTSGAQFISQIDQAIRGGGHTPGEQLFAFTAMGGQNVRSISGYTDLLRRQSLGILGPGNLQGHIELAKRIAGKNADGSVSEMGKMLLMKQFGLDINQADFFSSSYETGMMAKKSGETDKQFAERIEGELKKKGLLYGSLEQDVNKAMGQPGNARRQIDATTELEKMKVGEKVQPLIDKFQTGLNKFISSLMNGDGIWKAIKKGIEGNPLGQLVVGSLVVGGMVQAGTSLAGALAGSGLTLAALKKLHAKSPQAAMEALEQGAKKAGAKNFLKVLGKVGAKGLGPLISMLPIWDETLGEGEDEESLIRNYNKKNRYNKKTGEWEKISSVMDGDYGKALVDEIKGLRQDLRNPNGGNMNIALIPAPGMNVAIG